MASMGVMCPENHRAPDMFFSKQCLHCRGSGDSRVGAKMLLSFGAAKYSLTSALVLPGWMNSGWILGVTLDGSCCPPPGVLWRFLASQDAFSVAYLPASLRCSLGVLYLPPWLLACQPACLPAYLPARLPACLLMCSCASLLARMSVFLPARRPVT